MTPLDPSLDHSLDRTIVIGAPRQVVFRYFTDPERFAAWWGAGSSIEGQPGGAVRIRYPNGIEAGGEVLEIASGERVVFSFGYVSGQPFPPGSSRVTIELADDPAGTRLTLRHDLADAAARDIHRAGWRYQLALFANVAADEAQAALAERADAWFAAWAEIDAGRRRALLEECATDDVRFQDRFGSVAGRDELDAQIAAAQFHMPGVRMRREGRPRHCQGTALVDWVAEGPDGSSIGGGTNVLRLDPDGRIAGVVGFWGGGG